MCMKVYTLYRCPPPAMGGCDNFYAEFLQDEECDRTGLPGLPYADCRFVWGAFDAEIGGVPNRIDWYSERRAANPCPACRHAREVEYLHAEAERERRGEYSDRVRALVADLTRRAELSEAAYMTKCYNAMWDATRNLISSLAGRADAVWDGIEAALWTQFGPAAVSHPEVQGLVRSLLEAKNAIVGHVETTTREMATALVGPRFNWEGEQEM